jgi:NAD+ kinase
LGNVGFLAEIAQPTADEIVSAIRNGEFHREPRLVLKYEVLRNEKSIYQGWALNEVTVERSSTQMLELFLQIDGRPLSKWGCDGVICATPTGSTAYAFSAGGPVVWPEVSALVLLPLAAHALFSRPMVVSPDCEIVIDVISNEAQISADGLRQMELSVGDRIILTKDQDKIQLAYINEGNFTDRLVAKFRLPIEGWRGESS